MLYFDLYAKDGRCMYMIGSSQLGNLRVAMLRVCLSVQECS